MTDGVGVGAGVDGDFGVDDTVGVDGGAEDGGGAEVDGGAEDGGGVTPVMTRAYDADVVVPAVAVTTTAKLPSAPGVPLIVPVDDMLRPVGSPLAVYVMVPVPPVATTVAL
jgi:hypothetical protein